MNILPGIESSAAALNAERIRMEVISQNIANVNTTHGPDGKPYQRQQVVFETVLQQQQADPGGPGGSLKAVQVSRIENDPSPPRMIHNPSHPDADAQGMVAMPNINVHSEMVDLISASRAFEANLAVVKNARAMALQALGIGKRG
ncbi:MAG: flagellar basal body rod protein FlgC [Chloroflexi bacterium]|nr:flagellar basal body rod protein FlgC [Chloroflexota bacterium]